MQGRPLGTTQMILHAAARVLGCGSVQMMLADHERQALVFTTSIQNRELQRVREVESVLGFQLAGALVDDQSLAQIRNAIGPRTFAAVPFAARSGILGVLLFEKPGRTGF